MENNTAEKIFRKAKELTPEELEKITGAGSYTIEWYCTACNSSGPVEGPLPFYCPSCGSDAIMIGTISLSQEFLSMKP